MKNEIVFNISLFHNYFKDGKTGSLSLKPSDETLNIFSLGYFALKVNDNGLSLIKTDDAELEEKLKVIINQKEVDTFEFEINSKDEFCFNYTDLSIGNREEYQFSNKSELNSIGDASIILNPTKIDTDASNSIGKVKIDLWELIKQSSNGTLNYEIHLETRKTQWNYFVVHQDSELNLKIKGNSVINFEGPVEVMLPNGTKASKFSSMDSLIPMKEIYDFSFDLINEIPTHSGIPREEVVVPVLPSPNPINLQMEQSHEGQIAISNIYVYM